MLGFIRDGWDRIWFARFDPLSVGVFRICLGTLLVAFYAALSPVWDRYYGPDGILSLDAMDPTRSAQDWWSLFYWTEGVVPVRAYWWVGCVSAISFTVGWQTRLCTILLYAIQSSMIHTNRAVVNGEDLVFRMLLFYGCFAPLGATFSIDRWLHRRNGGMEMAPGSLTAPRIWPVRLMQINIALIYFISLPFKLVDDTAWLGGTAIYWTVTNEMWSRWPWPKLFYATIPTALASYGTILVEAAFPILVWFRRPKLYVLAAIGGLQVVIAIVLQNVTFFSLAMVCSFWVFVTADVTRRWGFGLARFVRRAVGTSQEGDLEPAGRGVGTCR